VIQGISGISTKVNTFIQDDLQIKVLYVADDQDKVDDDQSDKLKSPGLLP
jgi:hypothetical protein